MCGRFALVSDAGSISERFDVPKVSYEFKPNWNVSPGQCVPAVIHRAGQNILTPFLWGLIPAWAKDPSIGHKLINARAETVHKKPSFRDGFENRRCLIIADGFYEWKRDGKKKIPYYFYLKSREPFGLAGLFESWLSPDHILVNTCTIITTASNELIQPFHDRMPAIVPKGQELRWIIGKGEDRSLLRSFLKPYPANEMEYQMGMGPEFSLSFQRPEIMPEY